MTTVTGKTQAKKPAAGGRSLGASERAEIVAEIAERRRADVGRELGSRTYRTLAERAAEDSAQPGAAPRPIVERLAAPGLHLIAEVKRRSPSAGAIAADADPVALARAYEAGGASAISVLCEPHWFGGSVADVRAVRAAVTLPILAKEFVVDERQLPVLRSAGADVVLLLASILPPKRLFRFAELARELGLEPLVEAHDERELEAALATDARLIGLNNRNLRTLTVDPELCLRLRPLVPDDRLVIGESGVGEARTLVGWRAVGLDAALIGEALMRSADPASAARAFVGAGSVPHDVAAAARRPLVKICGITDADGVMAAIRAGVDAIGLNLVPGTPRALTLAEASYLAALARSASPAGKRPQIVTVFVDAPAAEIDRGHRGHRSRRDPAFRRRARFGDRRDPAPGLEGSAPAGRERRRRRHCGRRGGGLRLRGSGGRRRNRGRQDVPRRRHRAPRSRYRRRPVPRRDRPADRPPDRGRRRPRDPDRARRRPRRRQRGRGRAGRARHRRRRRVRRRDPSVEGFGERRILDRSGRGGRRFATAQGSAPGRALRQACSCRPLRSAARPAASDSRAGGAARTRRRGRAGASTATSEDGTCRRRWSPPSIELEAAWLETRHDPRFWAELREMQFHYGGRPTPIYRADRLGVEILEAARELVAARVGAAAGSSASTGDRASALPDRLRLYLKREDLNHTGAHKLNNALGQVLLTRRLGKTRVIAETGAGMHGVATATACALLDIPCVVHMGIEDIHRQAPNVLRMEALGAEVRPVYGGSGTLKDAVSEALRDWVTNVETSHYCLGSTMGPHPYPQIVRDFQRVIGDEAAAQLEATEGRLPGSGNRLRGRRLERPRSAPPVHRRAECSARRGGGGGGGDRHRPPRRRPARAERRASCTVRARTCSRTPTARSSRRSRSRPGSTTPGIGPQLSALMAAGRLVVSSATDSEAVAAMRQVARTEGILAAVESAHAVAALPDVLARLAVAAGSGDTARQRVAADTARQIVAPDAARQRVAADTPAPLPREAVVVLGLSGRGDKDLAALGLEEVGR